MLGNAVRVFKPGNAVKVFMPGNAVRISMPGNAIRFFMSGNPVRVSMPGNAIRVSMPGSAVRDFRPGCCRKHILHKVRLTALRAVKIWSRGEDQAISKLFQSQRAAGNGRGGGYAASEQPPELTVLVPE